jgi:hypothetical protein
LTPVDNGSLIVYLDVNSLKNKKSDPIHILMDSKLTSKKRKKKKNSGTLSHFRSHWTPSDRKLSMAVDKSRFP